MFKPQRQRDPGARRLTSIVADEMRFLANWARRPLTTGAVSPSGRALARAMVGIVDPSWSGVVVELGPGTGAVTRALLERGVAPEKLAAVEFNGDFVRGLKARFPGVHVIEGDAYGLKATLARAGVGEVSAVVSSLPLFTRPPAQREALIAEAMTLLPPGRPFIQFSYALVPPVPRSPGRWTLDVSDWIIRNLPPARVWTYRSDSAS